MSKQNDAISGASFKKEAPKKIKSPWPGKPGMIPVTSGQADDANLINRAYLDKITIEMRLIDAIKPDLTTSFFGKKFASPLALAPVSHLNYVLDDKTRKPMQEKAAAAQHLHLLNWIGMESDQEYSEIVAAGNPQENIRIIKPFADHERIIHEIKIAEQDHALAVGIDIDHVPGENGDYDVVDGVPMGPLSESELKRIVDHTKLPFIAKGVLSVQDALKAKEAGCAAVVISHHHGRMPFGVPPLKMLPAIEKALNNSSMTIFVDGSIMSGYDAYKALALGADGVLIGRGILPELLQDGSSGMESKIKEMDQQLSRLMLYTGIENTKSFDSSVLHF